MAGSTFYIFERVGLSTKQCTTLYEHEITERRHLVSRIDLAKIAFQLRDNNDLLCPLCSTLMANVPFVSFLFSLAWVVGMGIFATYYNCDPMITGDINRMDEILPYFIDQKLSYIPGFIGLFMATLFNGSLWYVLQLFRWIKLRACNHNIDLIYSIFVSTLNSLATVTWEDFLSPLNTFQKRSDRFQLVFIKSLGVMYAVLTMGVAFLVSLFSGVIEISMFVNAATSGTLVGVFLLAMLIPFANSKVNIRWFVLHSIHEGIKRWSDMSRTMSDHRFISFVIYCLEKIFIQRLYSFYILSL